MGEVKPFWGMVVAQFELFRLLRRPEHPWCDQRPEGVRVRHRAIRREIPRSA